MKKLSFPLMIICLIAGGFVSCKKDSTNNGSAKSSITLLTSARWTFQKFTYEKADGTWVADPDSVDADKFTIGFNTDNTLTQIDDGTNYTASGTWHFSSNNTVLTTTGSTGYDLLPAAYTVTTLTSLTLVLTQLNYPQSGIYIDERLTFTH